MSNSGTFWREHRGWRRPRPWWLAAAIAAAGLGPLAGSAQAAPVNGTPPSITGLTPQGSTLTYHAGVWAGLGLPPTITYVWEDCTSAGACAPIAGTAGQATYVLKASDVADSVEVVETATDLTGTASQASNKIGPVTPPTPPPPPPAPTAGAQAPILSSDTAQVGQTLKVSYNGDWTNSPTGYHYQWDRCKATCETSPGSSDSPSFTVPTDDVGYQIEALVAAYNTGGQSGYRASNQTSPVPAPTQPPPTSVPPPVSTAAPSISGTAQQGFTLTETSGGWTGATSPIAIQWYVCNARGSACVLAFGSTGPTFALTGADVGRTVVVSETTSNSGGSTTVYSDPEGPVTDVTGAVPTTPTSTSLAASPTAPVAAQAVTLIANVASASSSAPPSGALTFTDSGAPIFGCTALPVRALSQTATMTCTAAFGASTAAIAAQFSPTTGSGLTGSQSSAMSLAIGRAPSSVSVSSPARVDLGSRITYTAHVRAPAGSTGAVLPAGVVAFLDGSNVIKHCQAVTLTGGAARCRLSYTGLGRHHISVSYGGDANFSASRSGARLVRISPATPTGYVTSYLSWSFAFGPTSTRVGSLVVTGLTRGLQLYVGCSGHGCAIHHTIVVAPTCAMTNGRRHCSLPASVNLTTEFKGHRLLAGTRLTVLMSHPHWLGKAYEFTMRAGRKPQITESCLEVNGTRPGVGCSSH